ncbi:MULTISPECIES: hypothetical protein [Yersinia]|uniref:Uncharacterized protein n=1 Tax=Yersinia frederiksenii TaxID=29484 RepID=A0AAI8ZQY8_YERFR|nr:MULTISPECIES: hypothetical protein [Yersinia]MDN0126137.1 hypothetical protein [Yersinia massiliensis]CFQ99425.1 Uncharacterised protein [Yersinia frederiksenii]CQH60210.1 Uncharacterised protein [Yersinia frederiksenii]
MEINSYRNKNTTSINRVDNASINQKSPENNNKSVGRFIKHVQKVKRVPLSAITAKIARHTLNEQRLEKHPSLLMLPQNVYINPVQQDISGETKIPLASVITHIKPNTISRNTKPLEANADLINELKIKLEARNNTRGVVENKKSSEPNKFQKEIDAAKAKYKSEEPTRIAKEITNDIRIAKAKEAEAKLALAAEQESKMELGQVNTTLKLDAKGIPLPPPMPKEQSVHHQGTANLAGKQMNTKPKHVGLNAKLEVKMNSVIQELTLKLAEKGPAKLLTENKHNDDGNKFRTEIAKEREQYSLDSPKRLEAERIMDAKVAKALSDEKALALEAGNVSKIQEFKASLKLDAKGIPLPPPMPTA